MVSGSKWLGMLLALWGLFLMGAPLWVETQVSVVGSTDGSTLPGMMATGLTGVLAGLGIMAVSSRLDSLGREQEGRPDRRVR